MKIHPVFHVSLLRPVTLGILNEEGVAVALPVAKEIGGAPAYRVHRLLDSHRHRDGLQYLMDWEGYGPEERCWVPACDILSQELIEEFHLERPDRPAPHPKGWPPSQPQVRHRRGRRVVSGRPQRSGGPVGGGTGVVFLPIQ